MWCLHTTLVSFVVRSAAFPGEVGDTFRNRHDYCTSSSTKGDGRQQAQRTTEYIRRGDHSFIYVPVSVRVCDKRSTRPSPSQSRESRVVSTRDCTTPGPRETHLLSRVWRLSKANQPPYEAGALSDKRSQQQHPREKKHNSRIVLAVAHALASLWKDLGGLLRLLSCHLFLGSRPRETAAAQEQQ